MSSVWKNLPQVKCSAYRCHLCKTDFSIGSMVARLSCLCSFHNGMNLTCAWLSARLTEYSRQLVCRPGCSVDEAALFMLVEAARVIECWIPHRTAHYRPHALGAHYSTLDYGYIRFFMLAGDHSPSRPSKYMLRGMRASSIRMTLEKSS